MTTINTDIAPVLNVLDTPLLLCSLDPLTGFCATALAAPTR